MLVHRADMTASERQEFEQAIRASGKDPLAFKAELFEATLAGVGRTLRRVHVVTCNAAAQYEASAGRSWTKIFARHLARGVFG
jgi:hypothetical protein